MTGIVIVIVIVAAAVAVAAGGIMMVRCIVMAVGMRLQRRRMLIRMIGMRSRVGRRRHRYLHGLRGSGSV